MPTLIQSYAVQEGGAEVHVTNWHKLLEPQGSMKQKKGNKMHLVKINLHFIPFLFRTKSNEF
jgi:hypothetical protein